MTTKTTTPKKTTPTPAPKVEKPTMMPNPREQRLVIGEVADFGKMEWVFGREGNFSVLEVMDEEEYVCCYYTVAQAEALMNWLQDVVPLMQAAPSDPTAPLVRYVP